MATLRLYFSWKKLLDENKDWIACIFEERITLKYRKNVEFFAFYNPSLNYKCILPDRTYFTGKGQRTEKKLMLVSHISVVKLLQTCLLVLCRCVPLHKCNITYCKCNIASLCNTSSLNTKTIGFEILLSMVYLTRSRCISFEKSKISTLLVCIIFFWHFKTFYRHHHSKCCLPRPRCLDLNAFKTFAFCFLKSRCAHIFSVLPPEMSHLLLLTMVRLLLMLGLGYKKGAAISFRLLHL